MKKKTLFFTVYIFWVLLIPHAGLAQRQPGLFRFDHITINEGLSHSDAMCVVQDKAGYIWVGTNKGIDRYDGYVLKRYELPLDDKNGVGSNRIRALHVDRTGRLWVGTESAGLLLYDEDRDRFVSVRYLTGTSTFASLGQQLTHTDVYAIQSDNQNRIWVATVQYGVLGLQLDNQGSIRSLKSVRMLNKPGGEPLVNRLAIDNQGKIWIGTLGEGLWIFDEKKITANQTSWQAAQVAALGNSYIRALRIDARGDLWIGHGKQVSWVPGNNLPLAAAIRPLLLQRTVADIENLVVDSSKRLWIGTKYGLLLMQLGLVTDSTPPITESQVRTFLPISSDPTSINSVRVHDILEDRFHNLWFATSEGGLNQLKFRSKPFGLIFRQIVGQTIPADNYINVIFNERTGHRLWLGTRNGFASFDTTSRTYQNYLTRTLTGKANGVDVSAVIRARDGKLWIGTNYGGLYTMDGQNESSIRKLPNVPGKREWNYTGIESIVEDRHGTIWVATINAGIHSYDQHGVYLGTFDQTHNALPSHQFTAFYYEPTTDILWASTRDAGLLKLRIIPQGLRLLKHFKHQPNNPFSLRTNYAWPLVKDRQGDLWIGTIGGGLHRLTRKTNGQEVIERFSQWVPETDIESLLLDETGQMWIGGAGLYRFNPTTKRLFHYDLTDGLQSNSFKIGAAYQAEDGTLYFGGNNGITYFQPRSLLPNPYPPLVQFTELRVLNQPVAVGDTINGRVLLPKPLSSFPTIRLNASENDFSIEFVGLNYANPAKQQYAYRLEGYHNKWIRTTSNHRLVSYTNLPAGDYSFLVKASNDDGVWSTKPARLSITILPPWWKTWWAYLLYATLLVGSLLLYRWNEMTQQKLKNKLVLERYKSEKEKEVTDTKIRFFTNVSHELRTPLTLILGPIEELASAGTGSLDHWKDKILLVHRQARKLLDMVNQLMEFRKVESGHVSLRISQDNIMTLLTEIFLMFNLKAEELHLDYAMEAPTEAIPMYFDRNKLEIVLTNLLSNAFKYTPKGGRISLQVSVIGSPDMSAVFKDQTLETNYLQLTVRDWGVGLKAEEADKVFDPYYQASHTETMRIEGTGIGLSLVKQFVEAHSGTVSVQSTPGYGTTFTIRLPFGKAHLAPESIYENSSHSEFPLALSANGVEYTNNSYSPVQSARILLVEDNDELRGYIQQLFTPAFDVFSAVDGVDGWKKTLELVPDLVISDVMMPRSNGLELCQKIKQHPKTMHIPIVLLTARSTTMHELEGLETGADEYVVKPFNPSLFYTKIAVMLHNRHRLKEYYQRQILLEPTDIIIPDKEKLLLEKAMSIVEDNLTNSDFSIAILAREMGMSQSTLARQIKAVTGQPVVEFIRDIRLKKAAKLLISGNLRISEVAYQVGFNDVKYFRKSFLSRYDLTPTDYVKQFREEITISDASSTENGQSICRDKMK